MNPTPAHATIAQVLTMLAGSATLLGWAYFAGQLATHITTTTADLNEIRKLEETNHQLLEILTHKAEPDPKPEAKMNIQSTATLQEIAAAGGLPSGTYLQAAIPSSSQKVAEYNVLKCTTPGESGLSEPGWGQAPVGGIYTEEADFLPNPPAVWQVQHWKPTGYKPNWTPATQYNLNAEIQANIPRAPNPAKLKAAKKPKRHSSKTKGTSADNTQCRNVYTNPLVPGGGSSGNILVRIPGLFNPAQRRVNRQAQAYLARAAYYNTFKTSRLASIWQSQLSTFLITNNKGQQITPTLWQLYMWASLLYAADPYGWVTAGIPTPYVNLDFKPQPAMPLTSLPTPFNDQQTMWDVSFTPPGQFQATVVRYSYGDTYAYFALYLSPRATLNPSNPPLALCALGSTTYQGPVTPPSKTFTIDFGDVRPLCFPDFKTGIPWMWGLRLSYNGYGPFSPIATGIATF